MNAPPRASRKTTKRIKKFDAGYAVMAGQVTPGYSDLKANACARKNAETIFGAIGDEIEKAGVHLLDARVFMDEDLAEEGVKTRKRLTKRT